MVTLANATLLRPDLKALKANPAAVVALDCSNINQKPSASVLRALPKFPLRVLSLRRRKFAAIPPELSALTDLEVLSLTECYPRHPLGRMLTPLTRLRGLTLGECRDELVIGAEWPASLEAVDIHSWHRRSPERLLERTKLRHLVASGVAHVQHLLPAHPIESLVLDEALDLDVLAALPLRYLQLRDASVPVPPIASLEFVDLYGEVPAWLRRLPRLRGLWLNDPPALPDWLADLPIERIVIDCREPPRNSGVIERMKSLRAARLPEESTKLPRIPFNDSLTLFRSLLAPDDPLHWLARLEHVGEWPS